MKKGLTIFALVGVMFFVSQNEAQAQTEGFEIGLRFANANSAAIDFAMPLGENRLHANANFFNGGFGVTGIYDWQFAFGDGFMFYPGIGASMAIANSNFGFALGGEVGVEYGFDFPLSLGVDYQPMFAITNGGGYADGWGINARWRF